MARKRANDNQVTIGNITDVSGHITTLHTTSGLSASEIKQLFDQLYTAIEIRPGIPLKDKAELKDEVEEIRSTVTEAVKKNEKVDEGFLLRRFRNIARMAPDVLDVVVATLGSPLAGLGVAAKKIAEKAKEETKN